MSSPTSRSPSACATSWNGERIAFSLGDPVGFRGRRIEVSASVGVTWSGPGDEHIDADALVARADGALYVTKAAGGGGHTVR